MSKRNTVDYRRSRVNLVATDQNWLPGRCSATGCKGQVAYVFVSAGRLIGGGAFCSACFCKFGDRVGVMCAQNGYPAQAHRAEGLCRDRSGRWRSAERLF